MQRNANRVSFFPIAPPSLLLSSPFIPDINMLINPANLSFANFVMNYEQSRLVFNYKNYYLSGIKYTNY